MNAYIKDCIRRTRAWFLRCRMRQLPELPLPEGQTIIVAPHPDDEAIGCGGLIARLCAEGRPPHVIILTRGEASHRSCCSLSAEEIGNARHQLTLRAAQILDLPEQNIHPLHLPDGQIPSTPNEASPRTEDLKHTLQDIFSGKQYEDSSRNEKLKSCPELCTMNYALCTIYIPHWGEGWPDHINAAKLIRQLITEGTPGKRVCVVYEYCVWMWYYMVRGLDWKNAYALRMTKEEQAQKRQAIEAYVSPTAPCGTPWSGNLPAPFLAAHHHPTELYFRTQ